MNILILSRSLRNRLDRPIFAGLAAATGKTTVATLCMAVVVIATHSLSGGLSPVLRLAVVVGLGVLSYIAAARVLRIEVFSLLTGPGKAPQ